eukprot:1748910-Pleurochrysis_carterae.AAC.1
MFMLSSESITLVSHCAEEAGGMRTVAVTEHILKRAECSYGHSELAHITKEGSGKVNWFEREATASAYLCMRRGMKP